jgi:hypothetical protein
MNRNNEMKRVLAFCTLLGASAAALAQPVTCYFGGQIRSVIFTSENPALSGSLSPNTPLVVDGTQYLSGNPYVIGTLTVDPDYVSGSRLPVPVTFSMTFEGMTFTRTMKMSNGGEDTFNLSATEMQTHLEASMSTTGVFGPDRVNIDLKISNGVVTSGTFTFSDIEGAYVSLGSISGTIYSAVGSGT